MTVIFLDVDGVLNCANRWEHLPSVTQLAGGKLDPLAIARLKRLVDATDARIVVSSTWRCFHMEELTDALHRHGIDRSRVIGSTLDLSAANQSADLTIGTIRGDEIQAWLDEHPDVQQFVILDDDRDMGALLPRLVKTTWADGLLDEHVEAAIALLQSEAHVYAE